MAKFNFQRVVTKKKRRGENVSFSFQLQSCLCNATKLAIPGARSATMHVNPVTSVVLVSNPRVLDLWSRYSRDNSKVTYS